MSPPSFNLSLIVGILDDALQLLLCTLHSIFYIFKIHTLGKCKKITNAHKPSKAWTYRSSMFAPAVSPTKVKNLNRTGLSKASISPHDDGKSFSFARLSIIFTDNTIKLLFWMLEIRISILQRRLWMWVNCDHFRHGKAICLFHNTLTDNLSRGDYYFRALNPWYIAGKALFL